MAYSITKDGKVLDILYEKFSEQTYAVSLDGVVLGVVYSARERAWTSVPDKIDRCNMTVRGFGTRTQAMEHLLTLHRSKGTGYD